MEHSLKMERNKGSLIWQTVHFQNLIHIGILYLEQMKLYKNKTKQIFIISL